MATATAEPTTLPGLTESISIEKARLTAAIIPFDDDGNPVSRSTIDRWATKGLKPDPAGETIRLKRHFVGRRAMTTWQDVNEFCNEVTAAREAMTVRTRLASDVSREELADVGLDDVFSD